MVEVELIEFPAPSFATVPQPKLSKVRLGGQVRSGHLDRIMNSMDHAIVLIVLKEIGLIDFLASQAWSELKNYILALKAMSIAAKKRELIQFDVDDGETRTRFHAELSQIQGSNFKAEPVQMENGKVAYRIKIGGSANSSDS